MNKILLCEKQFFNSAKERIKKFDSFNILFIYIEVQVFIN